MRRLSCSRIGEGRPPVVLERRAWTLPGAGAEFLFCRDDISTATDWRIEEAHHAVVVHLGGRMDLLETEMEGHGGSAGAAVPGEVWTVPAGRRYASHAQGGAIHYAVIQVNPGDRVPEISRWAGERDAPLWRLLGRLASSTGSAASSDLAEMLSRELGQAVLSHLVKRLVPAAPASRSLEPAPRLDRFRTRLLRDHIADGLDSRLTLEDLAALAGMTTNHLLIAFRQAFGRTPLQYIIRERLRQAQRALLHTRKDITTIALEAGFSSHSHLTACFRKQVGVTPSAFRASPFAA